MIKHTHIGQYASERLRGIGFNEKFSKILAEIGSSTVEIVLTENSVPVLLENNFTREFIVDAFLDKFKNFETKINFISLISILDRYLPSEIYVCTILKLNDDQIFELVETLRITDSEIKQDTVTPREVQKQKIINILEKQKSLDYAKPLHSNTTHITNNYTGINKINHFSSTTYTGHPLRKNVVVVDNTRLRNDIKYKPSPHAFLPLPPSMKPHNVLSNNSSTSAKNDVSKPYTRPTSEIIHAKNSQLLFSSDFNEKNKIILDDLYTSNDDVSKTGSTTSDKANFN